jgi:subtilisin-like proprotein convertase family protein
VLEPSRSKPFRSNFACLALIFLLQLPVASLALDNGLTPVSLGASNGVSIRDRRTDDAAMVVFSNPAAISIADKTTGAGIPPNGIATPYPSNITVSGLVGTLSTITVTLTGYTATRPRDTDFALVGPNGVALLLMGDAGDLTAAAGVNITFSDAAATLVPNGSGSAIPTGTYRPTDVVNPVVGNDDFPAPGPAVVNAPAPAGSATLLGSYGGINPNGTWSLFAIDDSLGGGASSVTGGWSLDITTAGGAAATTTTVASNINPALTTQSVTFTSTTTSSAVPVTTGTVSFTRNGVAIPGCTGIALSASGNALCTNTFPEGAWTIQATYNGTPSFATSNGSLTQVINSPTIVTGTQFCNAGGISLPDSGTGFPYSSNMSVTGLTGLVTKVSVQVNNISLPRAQEFDLLLVGPQGQAFLMMSDTGNATAISGVNIFLDDDAALPLPAGTLTSGTFRPTDQAAGPTDTFPAPAPASFSRAAPAGTSTFASVFNGINGNGTWALYTLDDGLGGGTGSIGSWCLNFSVGPTAAGATVSGKVVGLDGRGVTGAVVTLTNTQGQTLSTRTNTFGYFRFSDVPAGSSYVAEVNSKKRRFAPQVIEVNDDLADVNFIEEDQ